MQNHAAWLRCAHWVASALILSTLLFPAEGVAAIDVSAAVELAGPTLAPQAPTLPWRSEVSTTASSRLADVALALAAIAAAFSILLAGKKRGRMWLIPLIALAALFGFFTNPAFYQVAAVEITDDTVQVHFHMGEAAVAAWDQIETVSIEEGAVFPVFTDDTMLVLRGSKLAKDVKIPAFIPEFGALAKVVVDRLGGAPALP